MSEEIKKPEPTPFEGIATGQQNTDEDKLNQQKEDEFVHKVYDEIASHFSSTRYKFYVVAPNLTIEPWPVIEAFLNKLPSGWLGADVGCGNGKYIAVNPSLCILGSDSFMGSRSANLIKICKDKGLEGLVADNLSLPYRTNCFDFSISVAVIHHITTPERRRRAIRELLRIVKPGGKLMIYVWALEQKSRRKFDGNTQDVLVPWVLQKAFQKPNQKDQLPEPVQDNPEPVYQRYYHLFKEGELEDLVLSSTDTHSSIKIIDKGYDKDNWFVELQRLS